MIQHPLEFIPLHLRKPLFYMFLSLTLVILGVFNMLDKPFRNPVSPNGIISLELAFTSYRVHEVITSWNNGEWSNLPLDDLGNPFFDIGIVDGYNILPFHYLFFGLGFDYLFMPVYALALSLGLLLAGYEKINWYRIFTAWVGWGVFIAALFDAVENYALFHMLASDVASPYPQIAGICAMIKFTLLSMGLVTIAAGKVIRK